LIFLFWVFVEKYKLGKKKKRAVVFLLWCVKFSFFFFFSFLLCVRVGFFTK
jgi:hypothetical protein